MQNENTSSPNGQAQPLPALKKNDDNLIWLDCEMSGLDPEKERLLEIAVIVTNSDLTVRVPGPVLVIHQSDELLGKMDAWNVGTHTRSGLIDKVRASTVTEAQAEETLIAFLRQYVSKGKSPMCGNTIGQDRRFLVKYMPRLEAFFHYRNLDVSTLKNWRGAGGQSCMQRSKSTKRTQRWPMWKSPSPSWSTTAPTSCAWSLRKPDDGQYAWQVARHGCAVAAWR